MSNKIADNSIVDNATDMSSINNNQKNNTKSSTKKNTKAKLISRKCGDNTLEREKININIIPKKKNLYDNHNIDKIQENKTVNFFGDNKKYLPSRPPLKIKYHFGNKNEKSRNSRNYFNLTSENNEQFGNVYNNTYENALPNMKNGKIVNIKSFIQKRINKNKDIKDSEKSSNPKNQTNMNPINYNRSNTISLNNDSSNNIPLEIKKKFILEKYNSIRHRRFFIENNNKNIGSSNTFSNKNNNKNKNGPLPKFQESQNNFDDKSQTIIQKQIEKIDDFINAQIIANQILVETLFKLADRMDKLIEILIIKNN